MIINAHNLIHARDAGNGYHGWCEHCKVDLVTDLGYCSWYNLKCIDREIVKYGDIPSIITSYATFHGLRWDNDNKTFNKSYSDDVFTIDELNDVIKEIVLIEN